MGDAVDKIFEEDPNCTVVEGEKQAWLLSGDVAKKVAATVLPKPEKQKSQ